MSATFIGPYLVLWATLMRALVVRAKLAPPSCARCGRVRERSHLGETICRCHWIEWTVQGSGPRGVL